MPVEFVLDAPPAGYSMANASGVEGNPAWIAVREFTSSEDGDLFVSRLEGIPSQLIAKIPPELGVRASTVDHMLAVIRSDLRTTLYVNECTLAVRARFGRRIEAGEPVYNKDIIDIDSLMFDGVDIPEDAAVVVVISDGWRKGLFFDFAPLGPDTPKRDYDLNKLLGSYLAYIKNQALFQLDAADWEFLIGRNWFPFLTLSASLKSKLVSFAKGKDDVDRLLPEVVSEVKELIPNMLQRWPESAFFEPHLPFIRHAIEEFQESDFVSCTAILYPRIEGLLRTLHERTGVAEKATQEVLSETAVERHGLDLHRYSWLLPEMFRRYLQEAYFANFQPGQPAALSRNSLGHGVASIEEFNEKGAAIGLLILDQLFYFLPAAPPSQVPAG
jgi:hypothetical protein